MKTIKEWQKAAYDLAVKKGFHSRECKDCRGTREYQIGEACYFCKGTGRVPIDPHSPTRIASRLAAIHREISEAYECMARGRMKLYYCDPIVGCQNGTYVVSARRPANLCHGDGPAKPEGFPIELADVFLRLCDLAESLGLELGPCKPELDDEFDGSPEHIAANLAGLHSTVSDVGFYAHEGSGLTAALEAVLQELTSIARMTGVDLLAMAELKHEYNKTRPIMHGKIL